MNISKENYMLLLFIDFSSAVNAIVPLRLKLRELRLSSSLSSWIQSFLTDR